MIVNYYIEIHRTQFESEHERLRRLAQFLLKNNYQVYDATNFDSCTSGYCKLNTLDEIEKAIEGE